jgi:hypothetical protein
MATLEDLVQAILDEFPDVRADVEAFRGLPYIQLGVLADLAQRAKGASDWDTYRHVVNLVTRFLDDAHPELSNAIHVSILEHLDFIGPRGMKAWQLMPPELQSAWRSIMEYNERLLGHPRPEGRIKPWEQPPKSPQTVAALRSKRTRARRRR